MLMASELMRFYQTIDRAVTVENIKWNTTITKFKCQLEVIEKKAEGKSDPPIIAKNFSNMRRSEAIDDHLSLKACLKMTPLSHAVR